MQKDFFLLANFQDSKIHANPAFNCPFFGVFWKNNFQLI